MNKELLLLIKVPSLWCIKLFLGSSFWYWKFWRNQRDSPRDAGELPIRKDSSRHHTKSVVKVRVLTMCLLVDAICECIIAIFRDRHESLVSLKKLVSRGMTPKSQYCAACRRSILDFSAATDKSDNTIVVFGWVMTMRSNFSPGA